MSKDPNQKHYFKEIAHEQVGAVMTALVKLRPQLILWPQGKEDDKEIFIADRFDPGCHILFLKPEKKGLLSSLTRSKLLNMRLLVKLESPKMTYFSTTSLSRNEETGDYFVTFNDPVFVAQRRTNYRLNASHHLVLKLTINDEVFPCLDISAGGTSFTVPKVREEQFSKGVLYKGCKLQFNRKTFLLPQIMIAGVWPYEKTRKNTEEFIKCGVSFQNLTKETEEALFVMVNSEARAEEIRKMLIEQDEKAAS
jgi:hypothetical protein